MRARRGFRRVLYRKQGNPLMSDPFQRPVIQVDVTQLYVRIIEGFHIHTETMVLGRDFYFAGFQILHGLVSPTMPEFEFEGLTP